MSAVFGVRVGDDLHIFDELVMVNATTWDVADEINHRFGLERRKDVCPDPTGAARKTAGVGLTDHAILRKGGLKVSTPRSPWKIRDKVNCVNTVILDEAGTRPPQNPPPLPRNDQISSHACLRRQRPPQQETRRRPLFRRPRLPLPPKIQPQQRPQSRPIFIQVVRKCHPLNS